MKEDSIVRFHQPAALPEDPLTEVLRSGARQLLAQVAEIEVAGFIGAHADLTDGTPADRSPRVFAGAGCSNGDWAGGGEMSTGT